MLASLGLVAIALLSQPPPPSATLPASPGQRPLRVRWVDGRAELRAWSSEDASGGVDVLSVVGPMVAEHSRHDSAGANRWYTVDRLATRGAPEGFDLDRWLDESGQREDLPHALPPLDPALGPRGFAVVDWAPDSGLVTLEVERSPCDIVPAICELETTTLTLRPPPRWRPWLDAALAGRGVLGVELAGRVAGIAGARARRRFGHLMEALPRGGVVLLGRRHGGITRVAGATEGGERSARVCVYVDRVLSSPGPVHGERGRVRCFSAPNGSPEDRRALHRLGAGQRLAVVARDLSDGAPATALVPLTHRGWRMLAERYPETVWGR